MVPSSPKWQVITPTTLQKHDKYGRESSVSEMRIWFVSYLYRPGDWDGKEWAVQKIRRENEFQCIKIRIFDWIRSQVLGLKL